MKCDYCDLKATVFLTQLVDGQMKKVCLCAKCAEEKGVTDPTGFSLSDMFLKGLKQNIPASAPTSSSKSSSKTCPQCGFTIDDFLKVRRFGCGECYSVFSEELGQALGGMHKGIKHLGKVPAGLIESHFRIQRLSELKTKLNEAIAAESYEDAARLRDEIKNMEELEVRK